MLLLRLRLLLLLLLGLRLWSSRFLRLSVRRRLRLCLVRVVRRCLAGGRRGRETHLLTGAGLPGAETAVAPNERVSGLRIGQLNPRPGSPERTGSPNQFARLVKRF